MFEELIQNIAMLVTLAVALQLLAQGIPRTSTRYPLTAGVFFGLVAVFGMWQPFHFAPGIIYDGRSIVLSLAGAFGGPLTAGVAALIASGYRLYLGGAGAPVGVAVIWEAALLGSVLYRLRRQDDRWMQPLRLLAFGVLVHSGMLALQLFLPNNTGPTIIRQMGGVVLLAYPLGFLLSALLFLQMERRQEAEQALALQTHILEMSAKGAPLPQLLEALSREIESILPETRVSILLLDDDGLHLRHGAAPNLPAAYVQAIDGAAIGEGVGSCGTAVYRRAQVIVEDIRTDPLWVDYRELALAHNLRACWSTPILAEDGQVLGAFALYYHRPARPTPFHLRVVEQATHLAAIAILRDRQDRALKAERDFANQVMESIGQGLNITDAEGRITYVNPAYCTITGYTPEELLGRTPMELADPETAVRLEEVLEMRRGGASSTYEMTLRHKDGHPISVLATGAPRFQDGQYVGAIAILTDITERRRMEEALRASEERFRRLAESSLAGIYLIQDGKFRYVNQAFADMFGYAVEEIVHRLRPGDLTHPEDRSLVAKNIRQRLEGEREAIRYGFRGLRRDGAPFFVEVHGRRVHLENGPAILGVIIDVTTQKRYERQLEAQAQIAQAIGETGELSVLLERLLQAAIYAIPAAEKGAILLVDEEGRLRFRALSGYHDPRIYDLRFPTDAGYAARAFREQRSLIVPDARGDAGVRYDGDLEEVRSVRSAIVAPLFSQEKPIGVMSLDNLSQANAFDEQDIQVLVNLAATAALAIERSRFLEESIVRARQLEQIMQAAPQGVLLLSAKGRVILANPLARDYLEQLAKIDEEERITHLGQRTLAEILTTPPIGAWHEVRADAKVFEIIARPVPNGPEPEEWVMLLQDVTEQRQVQVQLQQQERLAAVGQMAAGIAHDFNNIMGVIVLQAAMAAQSDLSTERVQERLGIITAQAQHATELIQQILDFSRQSLLKRAVFDLGVFLREQAKLLARTLPESISIQVDVQPGDYTVYADPTRLQQAIMNLAINARDAMPGGGQLTVGLKQVHVGRRERPPAPGLRPGDWLCLTVTDTGKGIPPEDLPHIFEPFFTTKEAGRGSGLGLAQVHGIVVQHGGLVHVQSRPGAGASFFVFLPAHTKTVKKTGPDASAQQLPQGRGETILVVEDNEILCAAFVEMLRILNYRPRRAATGREALDILTTEGEEVDLVLSDVVMPDMGGVALTHALRSRGWDRPIILMSGHPQDQRTLEVDGLITALLTKPLTPERLAHVLIEALQPEGNA